MENKVPSYLLGKGVGQFEPVKGKKRKFSFVDKTLMNAGKALKSTTEMPQSTRTKKAPPLRTEK